MLKQYYRLNEASHLASRALGEDVDADELRLRGDQREIRLCFRFSGDLVVEDLLIFFDGDPKSDGLSLIRFDGFLQIPAGAAFVSEGVLVFKRASLIECIEASKNLDRGKFSDGESCRFLRFVATVSDGVPHTAGYRAFLETGNFEVNVADVLIPGDDFRKFVEFNRRAKKSVQGGQDLTVNSRDADFNADHTGPATEGGLCANPTNNASLETRVLITAAEKPEDHESLGVNWRAEVRRIAQKKGEEKWDRGERQITPRNMCELVATELAKDPTCWGNQGPRSASKVRTDALKGWIFTPPADVPPDVV